MGRKEKNQELQAGIFLVITLLLVSITILTLGKEKQIFTSQEEYYTAFEDVKGLKQGAPVRLGGITIGRVTDIFFGDDIADPLVYVTLQINSDYLLRIKEDSKTSIATQGLLGDRFLAISPGSIGKSLPPQAFIDSKSSGEIADILNTAGEVAQNVSTLTESLSTIFKDFEKDASGDLSKTVKNLAVITEEIHNGNGILHEVIFSEKKSKEFLDSIDTLGQSLSNIVVEIEDGKGLLHQLIYDKKSGEALGDLVDVAAHLSDASEALTKLLVAFQEEDSLMHELLFGAKTESFDGFTKKLGEIITNLHIASAALANGNGTIGALLIDSELYDNLIEVTDGAKRSYILRSAIREALQSSKEATSNK